MKALGIIKYTFSFIGLAFLVGAVFAYENTSRFLAQAANGVRSRLVTSDDSACGMLQGET